MKYAIERFLGNRKARLIIDLAVIVCLAWVVSLWINLAISQKLSEISRYEPPKPAVKKKSLKKADYSVIKRRNIFNPDAGSRKAAVRIPEDTDVKTAVPTALNLQLIGTVFADRDEDNFAVILDKGTREQNLLRVNDEVAPGATIVRISRLSVLIDNAGRMESLSIEMKPGSPGRIVKKKQARAPRSGSGKVWQVAEGHMVMDRRFLDKQLAKMNDLMTQVRAVPNKNKDGVMQGFKLFQIRKGSVFEKVGLKNHDVIQRVNGQSLNSVEKGLDLFAALRDENHFTLDILRNNAKKTITIEVQ